MVILHFSNQQQEQSASIPILFISGNIQLGQKRAKFLQNQAVTHFIILNEILTLCKFVFAEKCWQYDLLGNGNVGTPESGEKRRFITYGKDKLRIHRTRIDRHTLNFSKGS